MFCLRNACHAGCVPQNNVAYMICTRNEIETIAQIIKMFCKCSVMTNDCHYYPPCGTLKGTLQMNCVRVCFVNVFVLNAVH